MGYMAWGSVTKRLRGEETCLGCFQDGSEGLLRRRLLAMTVQVSGVLRAPRNDSTRDWVLGKAMKRLVNRTHIIIILTIR